MARGGRQRGRGTKRKHGRDHVDNLDKKQKYHLQQFGEMHPADEGTTSQQKFRKVVDTDDVEQKVEPPPETSSNSESEAEESAYQQLLSTFSHKSHDSDEGTDLETDSEEEIVEKSISSEVESDTSSGDERPDDKNEKQHLSSGSDDDKEVTEVAEKVESPPGEDYRKETYTLLEIKEDQVQHSDPFFKHFEVEIPSPLADSLPKQSSWKKEEKPISGLGRCIVSAPEGHAMETTDSKERDLTKLHVKLGLCNHVAQTNLKYAKPELPESESLTKLQHQLFSVVNNYQDLCYTDRDQKNGEQIRLVYCLHALNHVLKTRDRVVQNNTKLENESDVPDDCKDQGLTRPKVLIILPFRESAVRVINMLGKLLMTDKKSNIIKKKKFKGEFASVPKVEKSSKPEDYQAIFAGDTDDHFRISLSVIKKAIKLYTDFYRSDIILASPLGLRTIIGAEGDVKRHYDFLSSIEVLIFDQMDIFMMQNWEHILQIMAHINLQPKDSHGADFSRIRMWTLNGWSKYYRQTLLFSSVVMPEMNAIFNKQCLNYAGKFQLLKPHTTGSISQIVTPLPQIYHRISVSSLADVPDARFEFFKTQILPQYSDQEMCHTMIFIPSYFDFVRIRNYMKKETMSFQKLCEYTVDTSITRARSFFFHGRAHFLLYTERLHFYRRFQIKGIRHVIFYELPAYPHFYSEVTNMIRDFKTTKSLQSSSCEVLYTKYDAHKLSAIVGTDRASQVLNSEKPTHMFMTGNKT